MKYIFLTIAAWLLFSCSHTTQLQRFYILEMNTDSISIGPVDAPHIDALCEVALPRISQAYSHNKIGLRNKSHQLVYYTRHRWAENPDQSMADMIKAYLTRSNVFAEVGSRFWRVKPEYYLETEIHTLQVKEIDDELYAHLKISFHLKTYEERKNLVTHNSEEMVLLEDRDLNLFASTISDLFLRGLNGFSNKMIEALKQPKSGQ